MDTAESLNIQIEALLAQINALTIDSAASSHQDPYEKENGRLEKYLTDFTHREGVMLTVAGLFTLLPLSTTSGILSYFLLWVLPFLFLAIATYILSSKRLHVVRDTYGEVPNPYLTNSLLRKRYFDALFFHKLTDVLLVSFFTTFVMNYYIVTFFGLPDTKTSIILAVLSVFIGAIRYHFSSKSNTNNSSLPGIQAMGGTSAE